LKSFRNFFWFNLSKSEKVVTYFKQLLNLLFWDFEFTFSDLVDNVMWVFSVNGATDRVSSSQKFSANSSQIFGHGSVFHDSSGGQDIVPGDVTVVNDVLDLLSVSWGFFQSFDQERRGGWNDGDLGLSVLDGQLNGDLQTFPFFGVLADIVTDFLWGESEWTDLWSKGSGWGDFTTDGSEADDLDGGRVKLWWHYESLKLLFL
jgi:hypothetical protein